MFKFFKLTSKNRNETQQPKNKTIWIKHGISEYFGTIMISLFLAGLSIKVGSGYRIEDYLLHPILVGFYAGFIAVGIVLVIFLRWSCDLNSAVTIYRMITGRNTYVYGLYKIFFQFLGGITAGVLIYAFGSINKDANKGVSNVGISAVASANKVFDAVLAKDSSITAGASWIFGIEFVMTAILLFPIFSPNINDKYRDLLICFIISMSVWMGLLGGTAAINPNRGLAQQVPALFWGAQAGGMKSSHDVISATMAMEMGTLLSPFLLVLVQGITAKYINPLFVKAIEYKNLKKQHMKITHENLHLPHPHPLPDLQPTAMARVHVPEQNRKE